MGKLWSEAHVKAVELFKVAFQSLRGKMFPSVRWLTEILHPSAAAPAPTGVPSQSLLRPRDSETLPTTCLNFLLLSSLKTSILTAYFTRVVDCRGSSGSLLSRQRLTCRLPRGQYSVTMQMLGGSMQAPMNLVRWLNWTSRI